MKFSCLAVETSTAIPSLAMVHGDRSAIRAEPGLKAPSRVVFEWLQELLNEVDCTLAELDCIAFGAGPGSFTGTRIAVAMAQGLGYASGRPLCAVSSLAALAAGVMRNTGADKVACCLDARLGEAYLGLYHRERDGTVAAMEPDMLLGPDEVHLPGVGEWVAAGSGWSAFPEMRQRLGKRIPRCLPAAVPGADDVAALAQRYFARGEVIAAADAAPNYLRIHVASLPKPVSSESLP